MDIRFIVRGRMDGKIASRLMKIPSRKYRLRRIRLGIIYRKWYFKGQRPTANGRADQSIRQIQPSGAGISPIWIPTSVL